MYDWPEEQAHVDARWRALADALAAEGFDAPAALTRGRDAMDLWLSPDLLIGETCMYPLETALAGRVRYLATPVHDARGCGSGTYRSVIVMGGLAADCPVPDSPGPDLPPLEGLRLAANMPDSMSGHVALMRDLETLGRTGPAAITWTGSHRQSVIAVATGKADAAAVDCISWALALKHEPAALAVHVAGWTAERPGLPLITAMHRSDGEVARLRRAVRAAIPAVVHPELA